MKYHSMKKLIRPRLWLVLLGALLPAHAAYAQQTTATPPTPTSAQGTNVAAAPAATTTTVQLSDVPEMDALRSAPLVVAATTATKQEPQVEPQSVSPSPAQNAPSPSATPQSATPQQISQPAEQRSRQPPATPTPAPSSATPTPLPSQVSPSPAPSPELNAPAPSPSSAPRVLPNAAPNVVPDAATRVAPDATAAAAAQQAEASLAVPSIAPDYRATPAPLPALERVGVNMAEQRPLTLREAIELALKNGKDIEVARTNVRAAEFDLSAARGAYEPRLVTAFFYERTKTPTASFLAGGEGGAVSQSGFAGKLGFEGLAPTGGGNYRFDLANSRQTTNSLFTAINPQYPSSFSFTYAQPLLRGYRFDATRRQIEIAKKNLSLTDAQFRQRAIETITNVQRAYWDLVFALRNLQIQRDAVRDARTQLEHNRRLVDEGMLAPIDIVAAEAQVAGFEQNVYVALDEVGRTENALKNQIAEDRKAEVWSVALVPTDTVDVPPPAVSLEDAMQSALTTRPELQQSDVTREINELDQRLAREATRTQVDLVGSYGALGLAGGFDATNSINPFSASSEITRLRINQLIAVAPPLPDGTRIQPLPAPAASAISDNLIGGAGQSLSNLLANRFNNFRVGVQLSIPLRNRTAQAQLGRTFVERDRLRVQREQLEQLIQVDVRNALQVTRTSESRLRAAAAQRSASEQQYASEQRKFESGQSTFFLVLERQNALATARGNELRAQTDLNKAIAELQRATGNALEANEVRVSVR